MIVAALTHVAAFYAGAACMTFLVVGGSLKNRLISALIWPSYPFWPG